MNTHEYAMTAFTLYFVPWQFSYTISKVQLKMLQITSLRAQQTVTIHCKNLGLGQKEPAFRGFRKGTSMQPEVVSSGCVVSVCLMVYYSLWVDS